MMETIEHDVELRPPQVVPRTLLRVRPARGTPRRTALLLAPAAGSGLDERTLSQLARGLSERGIAVGTFDFAYRRAGRRPPDRRDRLERAFEDVLAAFSRLTAVPHVVIGGRSMGGRIASLLAANGTGAGVVALAYPLHPGGRPDPRRTEHWPKITAPVLFVHGDRDRLCPVGDLDAARAVHLTSAVHRAHVVARADHGFVVRRRDGRTAADIRAELIDTVDGWLAETFEEDGHG
jgi:predicted alpha/beta-hydrolase family hydrolase